MSNLVPFLFENHPVRIIVKDGNPWFVASDICAALDYRHVPHAMRMIDDDEKGVHIVDTLGGKQAATIICEPGLYRLIEKSRKPEAVPFRRWIWHEVLPSIRKTGSYSLPKKQLPEPPKIANIPFNLLRDADYLVMVRNGKAIRKSVHFCELLEDRNAVWR